MLPHFTLCTYVLINNLRHVFSVMNLVHLTQNHRAAFFWFPGKKQSPNFSCSKFILPLLPHITQVLKESVPSLAFHRNNCEGYASLQNLADTVILTLHDISIINKTRAVPNVDMQLPHPYMFEVYFLVCSSSLTHEILRKEIHLSTISSQND